MSAAQQTYDLTTWNALVQIDGDIAAAAAYLGQFGQRYVDDLADSYLAIGEKRYLAAIVAKIQRQAEDEARGATAESPRATTEAHRDPEFDPVRWSVLASEDEDIAAAIAEVGKFGSYYAADLAASYQAIGDKCYLRRIVETIVAEVKADRARSTSAELASSADKPTANPPKTASKPESGSSWGENVHIGPWQFVPRPGSSQQPDENSARPEVSPPGGEKPVEPTRRLGAHRELALAALGVFLVLFVAAAGLTFHDYLTFRAAQGDADRLEAYEHKCWTCAFAAQARHEVAVAAEEKDYRQSRGDYQELDRYLSVCEICAYADLAKEEMALLKQKADQAAAARLREAAIAADRSNYQAARGDIDRLTAYLGACQYCFFKGAAESELSELHNQANIAAEEQARIAELQRQQQFGPPPNEPPHHVMWRITNGSGSAIATQFFSLSRIGLRWTGSKWPLIPGQTEDYDLACQSYEKICYGAWEVSENEMGHWGVGPLGTLGCGDCCIACDGGVHAFNLTNATATGESE